MNSIAEAVDPVAASVRQGLTADCKFLPPWLFYDERGSQLFEAITTLDEYYLTRTERALLEEHSVAVLGRLDAPVTVVELGAGTATKTGLLLRAAARLQGGVTYQPIDVSPTALEQARQSLQLELPGVTVRPVTANYVTEPFRLLHEPGRKVLTLYIGSSIGNFSPAEARAILRSVRAQQRPGDGLLLGTDLAPGPGKPVETLLAAYDDALGVTAEFNRNVLVRLNRELGANFALHCFRHRASWNCEQSRIEMHLEASHAQTVRIPANSAGPAFEVRLRAGETIHTENSYKFTREGIAALVGSAGFVLDTSFEDAGGRFALSLSLAV